MNRNTRTEDHSVPDQAPLKKNDRLTLPTKTIIRCDVAAVQKLVLKQLKREEIQDAKWPASRRNQHMEYKHAPWQNLNRGWRELGQCGDQYIQEAPHLS